MTNALKFTKSGGKIEIGGDYLRQQSSKDPGLIENFILVYVKDDGEGISPEDKPKLFKLFGKLK